MTLLCVTTALSLIMPAALLCYPRPSGFFTRGSPGKPASITGDTQLLHHPCLMLSSFSPPTLWDPVRCNSPGSSVYGDSLGKNTAVDCLFPPPGELPHPGIESACFISPALAGGFLTNRATWFFLILLQKEHPTQNRSPFPWGASSDSFSRN